MLAYLKKLWENQFVQAICFAVLLWLAFQIRTVLAILFLGFVVMSGFLPLVEYLLKRKVPRFLAIIVPYLILIIIVLIAGYIIVPVIISQTEQLIQSTPDLFARLSKSLAGGNGIIGNAIQTGFGSFSSFFVSIPGIIFQSSISLFTVLIISLYLLWDRTTIGKPYMWLISDAAGSGVLQNIEKSMGGWLRGQIILSAAVGVLAWVGLFILRIPFSAALAVLAGILEIIPYIGPILSAVIAVAVALSISWQTAVLVAILFFIIQQVEGNILVPQILKHSLEIHPITIIVSILIGTELMGILGAIVAVPVATALSVILHAHGFRVSRPENRRHT
jgi:predicted PurR-regulated permease PerM